MSDSTQPVVYQIRLAGHLSHEWTDWFGGVDISLEEGGDTILTCAVFDQSALHGLLRKVRDVGIPLLSVNGINPGQEGASDIQKMPEADIDL